MQKPNPILNMENVVSVSLLSELLKGVVETAFTRIKVKGEIHGLKKHTSGHIYLDLKEKSGGRDFILNGVIWKWTPLNIDLKDGMEVVATGKITTYAGRSSYQITIEAVEVEGEGALLKQIEDRKKKLQAEGLFDSARKKPLPFLPQKIGVITSATGAVFRDILHRISERFPVHVVLWPCAVQGDGADKFITAGIDGFNALPDSEKPDLLILARGGGSLQDLMPFNEENVVRAVANSKIPIISAVGHETDTTLVDYASDLRAPTPTGAAEKAVPVRSDLLQALQEKQLRLTRNIHNFLQTKKMQLDTQAGKILTPMRLVEDQIRRLDDRTTNLKEKMTYRLTFATQKVENFSRLLESYSFKKVLQRGFAIVKGKNDSVISSAEKAQTNPPEKIIFHDGEILLNTKPKQEGLF
ncbi:MAG: exodeoxyribonuclease VII large subunit [Alphaproteobacteria bacterium]|nr:exodeoxyribonuclease VII large subunit [Alphaproteobacteria bacterium]